MAGLDLKAIHGDADINGDVDAVELFVERFTRSGLELYDASADVDLEDHLRRIAIDAARAKGRPYDD